MSSKSILPGHKIPAPYPDAGLRRGSLRQVRGRLIKPWT